MLTLDQCRKLLPPGLVTITDEELIEIRNQLYTLGSLGLESFLKQSGSTGSPLVIYKEANE